MGEGALKRANEELGGRKAQGHKGTEWGEGITTDFTDKHGWGLNLDFDRDRDPDRKINDLEKGIDH